METKDINTLREEPHWSYSAFNTYLTCPLKYKFQYIDKVESERTGSYFTFGKAFHTALSERARKGNLMRADEVKDLFSTIFKVETDATENLVYKPGETYDTQLQMGFQMLEAAVQSWQDDFVVESVAEGFKVDVPGLKRPLIGEFDMVVTDCRDKCIVDWKTSSSKWPLGKADRDLQASAFCYAYKSLYGQRPLFRFDVITKAKTPTVNNYYTLRTDDALDRFVYLANKIEECVDNGIFYPNETGFTCADCPYADHCKRIHLRKEN